MVRAAPSPVNARRKCRSQLRSSSAAKLADDSNDGLTAGGNRRIADAATFFKRAFGARNGNRARPGDAGLLLQRGFCHPLLSHVVSYFENIWLSRSKVFRRFPTHRAQIRHGPGTTDSHSALIAKKYRSHLIFVQLVLDLYHFCTASIPSYSCFRIPVVLFSNGN